MVVIAVIWSFTFKSNEANVSLSNITNNLLKQWFILVLIFFPYSQLKAQIAITFHTLI